MSIFNDTVRSDGARPAACRILVVEDDAEIRSVEAALLRAKGYTVDVAEDGEAGWRKLNAAPYDLLITDHQMPRLSGMELIWRLHDAGFTLPVVMTSGLACVEIANPSHEPAPWFKAFLQKPFRPRDLIDVVKHVLAESEAITGRRAADLTVSPVPGK